MNNQKGISLVALIITIIVIVLLATIILNTLTGDDSVINKAKYARDLYEEIQVKDHFVALEMDTFMPFLITTQDINYVESTASIANPDRGFYASCSPGIKDDVSSYGSVNNAIASALDNKFSLVQLKFNLKNYLNRDLTPDSISNINAVFNALRTNNLKAVIRFAYEYDRSLYTNPSSFSQILRHVEQLAPVFETNKDVISVVEAGFIGVWGEMNDDTYGSLEYKKQLMSALLNSVPDSLTINLRRPSTYRSIYGESPISNITAHNGSSASRVGIFNDGYLGSSTDLGTYASGSRAQELAWQTIHNLYTIFGGESATETPDVVPENASLTNVVSELNATHTSYLNSTWTTCITDSWKAGTYNGTNSSYNGQTMFKYIGDHLGYRFVLKKSEITTGTTQGGIMGIDVNIANTGFGNVVNEKKAQIILQKGTSYYTIDTDIDVREWMTNTTSNERIVLSLPKNIPAGTWNVYLKISDIYNDSYGIQFANNDIWDTSLKANYIGQFNISIGDGPHTELKQINTYKTLLAANTPSNDYPSSMYMDGVISNRNEWSANDLLYSNPEYNTKIYIKNDDANIYILFQDDRIADSTLISSFLMKLNVPDATDNDRYPTNHSYNFRSEGTTLRCVKTLNTESSVSSSFAKKLNNIIEIRLSHTNFNTLTTNTVISNIGYDFMRNWSIVDGYSLNLENTVTYTITY